MATLQQQIAAKFLERFGASKKVDVSMIEELRRLLTEKRKPKADDFVKLFSKPAGGDVK